MGCQHNSCDTSNKNIKAIQMVQNKMARLMNCKTLKDKVQTKVLLEKANLLSVNQINAKVKLQEIWKILNVPDYPIKIEVNRVHDGQVATRAMTKGTPIELGSTNLISKTCISDAIKVWNLAPADIKSCTSLYSLNRKVKDFVKTLPI